MDIVKSLSMTCLDRPPCSRSLGLCVVVDVVNELDPVLKYFFAAVANEFGSNDPTEQADLLRNAWMEALGHVRELQLGIEREVDELPLEAAQ